MESDPIYDLLKLMHYIDMNPVRAGMTTHPREYPWSSYARYATGDDSANSAWLEAHQQYEALGANKNAQQATYRQLFRQTMPVVDLTTIREATNKGWALGNDRFREEIESLGARRAASKGRGRPRKEVEVAVNNGV